MYITNKLSIRNLGMFILTSLIIQACSTTKHLAEDEVLYLGVKTMEYDTKYETPIGIVASEEVEAALSYPPNDAILGSNKLKLPIPLGLWGYNAFYKYKDMKGVGRFFYNRFAEPPVYLSTVNPATRVKVASNLLHDYGYLRGYVTYDVDSTKHPQKAWVNYRIVMDQPTMIDSISFAKFPMALDTLIKRYPEKQLIKVGDQFNVVTLGEERERLSSLFRDHGYYYHQPTHITFRADTLHRPYGLDLQILPQTGIPANAHKAYHIGKINVDIVGHKGELPTDSMVFRDMIIHYAGKRPPIKENILRKRFLFKEGQLFSERRLNFTQRSISRMGLFKFADFAFEPQNDSPNCDTLDAKVTLALDKPYDSQLEFNVTTKSSDQTGPGAVFSISRRNFLRSAATLSAQIKGSYEWQTHKTENSSKLNSYEVGASVSLDFPRIVLPWIKDKIDGFTYPSGTSFKLYANQLNRARFFRMLSFGGSVSYNFQPSRSWKHTVTPFRLTYNTLQHTTAEFDSIINYNKSLAASLSDQFIPAMSYTFTYDNAYQKRRLSTWWETSVTESGNIMSLFFAAGGKGFNQPNKQLLNSVFAQFLKLTSEVRLLYKITEKHHLAGRFMAGAIYSYGNEKISPYSEQFYIGGANSIRAFTARSIGPGHYHPNSDARYGYIDETGDLKIEANIEYRFPILGDLYGAAFIDAGNVWLLRKDESRPDGQFGQKGLNSIALGTGAGIRYDLTFLVLRLDMGIGIHAPYDTGKKGYYNIPSFKDGLGLHFTIGYPF